MEVTGILEIKKVESSDEVSVKTGGGPQSKNDKPVGCCYISGVNTMER